MATITLVASTADSVRVAHAVGVRLGLGQDATAQQVHDFVAAQLATLVKTVEAQEAASAALTFT